MWKWVVCNEREHGGGISTASLSEHQLRLFPKRKEKAVVSAKGKARVRVDAGMVSIVVQGQTASTALAHTSADFRD